MVVFMGISLKRATILLQCTKWNYGQQQPKLLLSAISTRHAWNDAKYEDDDDDGDASADRVSDGMLRVDGCLAVVQWVN